jgi:hypothetical protein
MQSTPWHYYQQQPAPGGNYPHAAPTQQEMADPDEAVITHIDGLPIIEGTKRTDQLVGATFVQPSPVDFKGKQCLMFVFAVSLVFSSFQFSLAI